MPQQHYFYNVMRKTTIQFLDMFNNIVVARYNQDTGAIIKYVSVPLQFAPKTKQWYWKELKENNDIRDIVLPKMAVSMENVEFANDRQVNKNRRLSISSDSDTVKQYYNPVPYDYTFRLQIAAEYMVDITQIIEQIFPFFTPEAYIRVTIPELNIEGANEDDEFGADKLELRVTYEGSSKEAPVELDESGYRVLLWNLDFKVQGYMFSPQYETKLIHHVVQHYYLDEDSWNNRLLDVDVEIGDIGHGSTQGVTSATYIPPEGTPIDDTIRDMYKYEHYEE